MIQLGAAQITAALGKRPVGRLEVRLGTHDGPAEWDWIQFHLKLPLPDRDRLLAEAIDAVDFAMALCGKDPGIVTLDVITGVVHGVEPAGISALEETLLLLVNEQVVARIAPQVHARWSAQLATVARVFLDRTACARTALPRLWDTTLGQPVDDVAIEEVGTLHPPRRDEVADVLADALAAHLVGQMDASGVWIDVSHHLWEPRANLKVGDLGGVPANLLDGLATARAAADWPENSALDPAFLCGAFAAVLRTTLGHYRRPYGFLPNHVENTAGNPSGAQMRRMLPLARWIAADGGS